MATSCQNRASCQSRKSWKAKPLQKCQPLVVVYRFKHLRLFGGCPSKKLHFIKGQILRQVIANLATRKISAPLDLQQVRKCAESPGWQILDCANLESHGTSQINWHFLACAYPPCRSQKQNRGTPLKSNWVDHFSWETRAKTKPDCTEQL